MNDDGEKSDLTRREWLMRVGQAGAVARLPGALRGSLASTSIPSPAQTETALPPGLYEPSNDHLTHALGADGLFVPVPSGSETDFRRPQKGPFVPQFFSPEDFKVVGRLVEWMLGEHAGSALAPDNADGSPRSVAADVSQWVDFVAANSSGVRNAARQLAPLHRTLAVAYHGREPVERMENTDVEALCRGGFAELEKESQEQFGRHFLALSEGEQTKLLTAISDESTDAPVPEPPRKFFRWLKSQIINGFYRSPAGLKELDFKGNAFYGESPGCSGHDHPGGEGKM